MLSPFQQTLLKYQLYEACVQSPEWQVEYLPQFHRLLTGQKPMHFREDFCGSGRISRAWVEMASQHQATGCDIDSEALRVARRLNYSPLKDQQKKRLHYLRHDVLKPTRKKFDMIGAYNYSFCDFHTLTKLQRYFKSAHASLRPQGSLFLEVGGGRAFYQPSFLTESFNLPFGKGEHAWEQHGVHPSTQRGMFDIHFKIKTKDDPALRLIYSQAFHYDWRIWNLHELQSTLLKVGFKKVVILWEKRSARHNSTSQFEIKSLAELNPRHLHSPHSWIAYVVGLK
jgi:SAM-dependent methyltransferase